MWTSNVLGSEYSNSQMQSIENDLRKYVEEKNKIADIEERQSTSVNLSRIDISSLSPLQIEKIAEEIQYGGLMYTALGSQPMFFPGSATDDAFVQAIKAIEDRYPLKEKFIWISDRYDTFHYLINKDNLLDVIKAHQTTLERWIQEQIERSLDAQNPYIQERAKTEKNYLESTKRSPEEMMEYVIDFIKNYYYSTGQKISRLLLGYGVENAEKFASLYHDGLMTRSFDSKSNANISNTVKEICHTKCNFLAPPHLEVWDSLETAVLLTRYLNQSLDLKVKRNRRSRWYSGVSGFTENCGAK